MTKNLLISTGLHLIMIAITALSLPFLAKKPIDLPPIISMELIQISDSTSIPYAPKAKKIIEEIKKKEKEKLVSEQAPPKQLKKAYQIALGGRAYYSDIFSDDHGSFISAVAVTIGVPGKLALKLCVSDSLPSKSIKIASTIVSASVSKTCLGL